MSDFGSVYKLMKDFKKELDGFSKKIGRKLAVDIKKDIDEIKQIIEKAASGCVIEDGRTIIGICPKCEHENYISPDKCKEPVKCESCAEVFDIHKTESRKVKYKIDDDTFSSAFDRLEKLERKTGELEDIDDEIQDEIITWISDITAELDESIYELG